MRAIYPAGNVSTLETARHYSKASSLAKHPCGLKSALRERITGASPSPYLLASALHRMSSSLAQRQSQPDGGASTGLALLLEPPADMVEAIPHISQTLTCPDR
jgi:hypothetical protein